jgi:hypothetical protein
MEPVGTITGIAAAVTVSTNIAWLVPSVSLLAGLFRNSVAIIGFFNMFQL